MKTKEELYEALRADFEARSGTPVNDSSEIAVRLWAMAVELESLYCYADWSRKQSFPQTATGKYLDYHGQTRALEREDAVCAAGKVTFRLSAAKTEDVSIPKNTVVATAGQLLFRTDKTCVISAGKISVTVAATCTTAGVCGNVAANTVTVLTEAPAGVTGCNNAAAFTGGRERETDEDYRERILVSYQQLSTGANAAFYYQTAMALPSVAACKVIPRADGVGTVKVIIATKGGAPDELIRKYLENLFEQEREISTVVSVEFPEQVPFSATVQIWPKSEGGFDAAEEAVRAAIEDSFDGTMLGKNVYLTHLGQIILDTGLVENYAFSADSSDLQVADTQIPCLQSLSIVEADA